MHHDLWSDLKRGSAARTRSESNRELIGIGGIGVHSYDEILDRYLSFAAGIG